MESRDFISNITFLVKNENRILVSFNGQPITSRLSITKVQFFQMPMTLIESRYQTQTKPGTQKKGTEKQNQLSSLPQKLQFVRQNILTRDAFIVYKDSLYS